MTLRRTGTAIIFSSSFFFRQVLGFMAFGHNWLKINTPRTTNSNGGASGLARTRGFEGLWILETQTTHGLKQDLRRLKTFLMGF